LREPPPRPRPTRIVALPSSLFAADPPIVRAIKTGWVARALTVFRVEEVIIYLDRGDRKGATYLRDLLEYADTPQYLRKRLIPKKASLKYAGVLPPLRAPHHPTLNGRCFAQHYREGVVVKRLGDRVWVDVGLKEPVVVRTSAKLGQRVTVQMAEKPRVVPRSEVPYYWGYSVSIAESLREVVETSDADVRIATSRLGQDIRALLRPLKESLKASRRLLVAFGAHDRGLWEIAREEDASLDELFDYVINFIPHQGSFTVRSEEALWATLSILNTIA